MPHLKRWRIVEFDDLLLHSLDNPRPCMTGVAAP
jgi:hypothetical protein